MNPFTDRRKLIEKLVFKDRKGSQITREEWIELVHKPDQRIVNQQRVGDFFISTVWLGLPVGMYLEDYFETMVFSEPLEILDCLRYSTLEQAQAGHKAVVKEWENKLKHQVTF